jgi:tetratricopeptide (TPR) repeat protein
MPYQGCTTLRDVLRYVNELDHLPRSGNTFVKALKMPPVEAAVAPEVDGPLDSPVRAMLAKRTYVEAVVWLATQLADGLAYAHEHGIVHHDLKPANVLLSDDGRPMLLDFNAATDIKRPQEITACVAGTLPYMAPEQVATLHGDAAIVVDARSDLFALGIILYELLTARYPFKHRDVSFGAVFDQLMADRRCAPPYLRNWNPDVSPALEAIVRRCLEPDVTQRYQSARELCEDLQRQHDHRPLLHQREPSRIEQMRKWPRRHPRLPWIGLISLLSAILVSAFGALATSRGRELERLHALEIERTQQERQQVQAQTHWKRFRDDLKTVQFILYTRINEPEQRAAGIKRGMRLLESYDAVRNPEWQNAPVVKVLPVADRQQLAESMGELLLLVARGLRLQHNDQPIALRDTDNGFWAWFVLANCYDRLGNDAEAKACYATCVALKPDFEWAYFNRGLAQLRKQEYRGACADFDVVLKMRPDLVDAYLNRALARQGLKQFREAELDLTNALDRGGPTRLYFVRGRVREQLGDNEGGQRDFQAGLKTSPTDEKSWISRGYYLAAHDPKAALADFEQALRLNLRSLDALQNKAYVLAEKLGQNQQALEALERALQLYPDSVKARSGRGILYARLGQRELALRDAEDSLLRDGSPPRLYQVACIYALTSKEEPADRAQAFQYLSSSLRQGYGFNLLDSDTDLNNLRALPEFRRLVDAAKALRTPVMTPDKEL